MIVFLSHASRDYNLAGVLTITLRALGHPVQFAQHSPDENVTWADVFEKIKSSDAFIFMLTPRSLASSSCKLEYSYARALNKLIVMVLMDDIDFDAVPPEIYVIPYIDYRQLGDESFHAVEDALEASLQISPPSETAAAYPNLAPIIVALRKQVANPPPDSRSQLALVNDLKELSKRQETSADARSILKQLQTRNSLLPDVAQTLKNTESSLPRPEMGGRIAVLQIGLAIIILAVIGALVITILNREEPLIIDVTPIRVSTLSTGTTVVQNIVPTLPLTAEAAGGISAVTNSPVNDNSTNDNLSAGVSTSTNSDTFAGTSTATNSNTPIGINIVSSPTVAAQETQSAINVQNSTSTETIAVTAIFTPTLSPTPAATATLTQTVLPTSTATLTATITPSSTPTKTLTPTATPTATYTPTVTPTPTKTQTPTPTATFLPLVYTGVMVEDTSEGVRINRLSDSIVATGVQVGDYVLGVDVDRVNTRDEFLAALKDRSPFSFVTLRLRRGSEELFIRITLNALDFSAATPVPS